MKVSLSAFFLLILISACTNTTVSDSANQTTENIDTVLETFCFRRLSGSAGQDTSLVRLVINNNNVTGDFMNIPYEKDSRKGTLAGTKDGDIIRGLWTYMQEGMRDTLSVEFMLSGNSLLQKSYSVNPQTGRQYLSDTAKFVMEYNKIDCTNF